jgi:hypothetical protein
MERFIGVANRWYHKALNCEDSFDKFISIWISFNAIYGKREGSEFKKIKTIIRRFSNEDIKSILSLSEVEFFLKVDPPIKYINFEQEVKSTLLEQEEIKRSINRNPSLAIEKLMYILNKVRNNLFHGDKRIESNRDVDIVKNAYPIVRAIVQTHLRLVDNMELVTVEGEMKSDSVQKSVFYKIENLQHEVDKLLTTYDTIPKNTNHPISIMLDRLNMQGNILEFGEIIPDKMEDIQKKLLQKYIQNKPEVLRDIEEVHHFVTTRMSEVIVNGCTKEDVKNFYAEYIELQKKYLEKGYQFKI